MDAIQNELLYIANSIKGVFKYSHSMVLDVNQIIKSIQEKVYAI